MANTFFDFNTSLKNGEHILPPDDDDFTENEEDYDALNDETFGGLGDVSSDDWEQQHEQYAESDAISKHNEQLENSVSHLALDDDEDEPIYVSGKPGIWAYNPQTQNGDIFNSTILSSLQKASKSFIESYVDNSKLINLSNKLNNSAPLHFNENLPPKKICTLEELEKDLLKISSNVSNSINRHAQPPPHFNMLQQQRMSHPPPGMPPMGMPPPGLRHMSPHHNMPPNNMPPNQNMPGHPMPPGMLRMGVPPPHHQGPPGPHQGPPGPPSRHQGPPPQNFMGPNGPQMRPPPVPPGMMGYPPYQGGHPFSFPPPRGPPPNHPMNRNQMPYPPPHNLPQNQLQINHQHQPQNFPPHLQQQRVRKDSGSYNKSSLNSSLNSNSSSLMERNSMDEYAGLMTSREKQWLLNIQLLQLNTGTPYFDDYYYTVFKERKSKEIFPMEKALRFQNNNNRQNRNNERQENQNTLTPRVYTPLQFENSLGKLQCGSVTAPRKIIDMDIVTPDKDSDSPQVARETRKTKQMLIELESMYSLLLKAEDLKNPLAISNMETLREMKQKHRLRELELAATPEQKQEILKIFKQESEPVIENQLDYINKLVSGFLQEDKFASFLNIRKGKMLLLRTLPHLTIDVFGPQLFEIWSKVLLSLPVTSRRDQMGDNILPKFYPFFKRYIQNSTMTHILDIVSSLVEVVRVENNRSTPLSHQGKSPLYFVILNKFGVSALCLLVIRAEYLISCGTVGDKQQRDWYNFLVSWSDQTSAVAGKQASPLEPVPASTFKKHRVRFDMLNNFQKLSILDVYTTLRSLQPNITGRGGCASESCF